MPVLCRLANDGSGRVLSVHPIPPTGAVLGRGADADLFIDGNDVSRHHARVVPMAGGGWLVEELGRTNGVWVDGQRVGRAMLRDGAMVALASVGFRFNLGDPRQAATVYSEGASAAGAHVQPAPAAAVPPPTQAPVGGASVPDARDGGSKTGLVVAVVGVLAAGAVVGGASYLWPQWWVGLAHDQAGADPEIEPAPADSAAATSSPTERPDTAAPESPGSPGPDPRDVAAVEIGTKGGTIRFTDARPELEGIVITVPAGALDADLRLTVAKVEPPAPSFAAAAAEDAALSALSERMNGPRARFALANARFAGSAIDLGPSGTRFGSPVEVQVSLSKLGVQPNELPLPVLRGADGKWELIEDYRVEDGKLIAKVPHFSVLGVLAITGAVLTAFGVVVDQFAIQRAPGFLRKTAYAWLADTPKEVSATVASLDATYGDAYARAATCAGVDLSTPAGSAPSSNIAFGWALGMNDGMGEIPRKGQQPLDAWVRDQFKVQHELEKLGGTPVEHALTLPLLFGKAVELEGGNVFYALTSAHGMLAVGREVPPFNFMFADYGPGLIKDQMGGRYHLFGMAAYGFTFASNADAGWIDELASPENVALFEEAGISQDYWSDPDEFALDVHGAAMGRRIYQELRSASQASLRSRFPDAAKECDLEAKGELVLPRLPPGDTSIEEKSVTLHFDGIGGEVEGALRLRGHADFDDDRKSGPSKCSIRIDITLEMKGTYDPQSQRMAGLARIPADQPPKIDWNGSCWVSAKKQLDQAALDALVITWSGQRSAQSVDGRFEVPGKKSQSANFRTSIASR